LRLGPVPSKNVDILKEYLCALRYAIAVQIVEELQNGRKEVVRKKRCVMNKYQHGVGGEEKKKGEEE
jgi:hypothetical protein